MNDSSRSDSAHAPDAASTIDRDAKIEQLLLTGLDHYFSAQYQQAINVWTRALFLDRSHARARAYIERARSAMAERQRESEEMLQHGVDAFRRGESDEARRLLNAAIEGGAPTDEALAVLDRMNRLETTVPAAPHEQAERSAPSADSRRRSRAAAVTGRVCAVVAALVVIAVGGYATLSSLHVDWRTLSSLNVFIDTPPPPLPAPVARETVLPVPRRAETALARARALAASGHLRDALAALDGVRATDAEIADADRLRADLQRQLLAVIHQP
jgi:tetratricopeptide (TPR) repeat protein